ncbi:MAG: DUF4065 domain-containing protein [Planctomycetes bacterium]|nr:DUF4065 domain-containing protein [Planctomycetota bacterium]
MASVHDVASYILYKQGSMSTWKLQKLAYYSQAWSLVWDEKPLFDAQIQAWADGPVIPELYRLHRGKYSVKRWSEGSGARLTEEEKETIDAILASYGQLSGRRLSLITHNEDPWKDAREGLAPTERSTKQIKPGDMRAFYAWLDADSKAKPVAEIDWSALSAS